MPNKETGKHLWVLAGMFACRPLDTRASRRDAKKRVHSLLMYVSSTGSLVVFSPGNVTARQEVMWYVRYGITLWMIVAIITLRRTGWGEDVD